MAETFTYEEAHKIAIEYFKGEEISASVYLNKYALKDDQNRIIEASPDEMHARLAKEFARIDANKYGLNYDERYSLYFGAMKGFGRIVVQGSVMAAVGNPYQIMSASNCVVEASPEDSISGIFRTAHNLAQLYKRRCVAEGSKVITKEHGTINIENVLPGMHVLSFDLNKQKTVYHKVLDKFESDVDEDDRIIIKYSNGTELRTSKKHPVLEFGEHGFGYTEAGNIKAGSINVRPEKLDLSALNIGDWDFKTIKEHELAWFVGAHIGDGSADRVVTGDDRGRYKRVRFRILGDNEEVVAQYKNIHNYLTKNSSNYHKSYRTDYQTTCWEFSSAVVGNEDILSELMDDQIGSKTYSAFIPNSIDSDYKMWSFISGLIDTDGTVKQDGQQIVIGICARQVIDKVAAFLQSKGVSTHLIVRDNVRENEQTIYTLCIHYDMNLWDGLANRMSHDEKRNALRVYLSEKMTKQHSLRKPITKDEYDHILRHYDCLTKDWKNPDHKLLAANIYYMKKADVRGVGKAFLNQLVDFGIFSQDEANSIVSRVSVVEVIQDTESKKYYDIEVENTNNFYCGNFGLVVIHNCGVGFDLSTLRPEGLSVNNAARSTTGAWSFADLFSDVTRMIGQGGRRGALMITLDVHHPDVLKFATMKHDLTKVTGANVSLRLSDEFLTAVENDTDYEVRWPCNSPNPKIRKLVRARKVWEVIVDSATKSAEPGLIMWTNAVRTLPAHCYPQFESVSTNPSLRGDTKVLTSDGVFEIKDLDGKRIKVKNIIGEDCDADAFCSGKNKQLYKITFNHGQVVYCTKEHKWPILSTLNKVTDERSGKIYKKETWNLERGDKIPMVLLKNPINNTNSQFTSEDGFVLGWLYGDGWGTNISNDSIQFGFIFSDEEIDIGHKILAYTNKLAKTASNLKQDHNSKAVTFSTSDAKVNERFKLLKYGKKEYGIPESVWQGNCEFVNGFIDGLFSSDAYFKVNKEKPSSSRIVFVSSRKKLANDVQSLLMFYGIRSSIKETLGEFTRYDLTISGIQALKFANTFTISSNKKSCILEEIKNLNFQNPSSSKSSYTNDRCYSVIYSVEETDLYEDVYDITVHDGTHTFIMESGVTGNCSEIILSASDSCRLITQNLTAYVRNAFEKDAYFDFNAFRADAALMAQMGDNLVDLELELIARILNTIRETGTTEEDIKIEAAIWEKLYKAGHDGRRTGLGTHGLADTLAQLRLRYDSPEANAMVDVIYKSFKEAIYGASIELAKVRGTFPVFNYEIEKDNAFIKALPEEMQRDIEKYGRRNISMLTQAPTGSVSIISKIGEFDMYNVSSGVEPVFRVKYTRRKKVNPNDSGARVDFRDANGDCWQEYSIFSGNARAYLDKFGLDEKTPLPEFFVSSDEIDWTKRIAIQSTEQKHIDHSISSTINLPAGTPKSVVANLYLEAWKQGLKGVTVYVDGSRDGVLVTGEKQALKAKEYLVGHYSEVFDSSAFKMWSDIEDKYNQVTENLRNTAIERNKALGDFNWEAAEAIEMPKLTKQNLYDMFSPLFNEQEISAAPKRLKILPAEVHKIRIDFGDGEPRNAYVTVSFFPGTKRPYEILVQAPYFGLGEKDLQILEVTARSTSMLLRHKVPIMFICEQLDKVGGQYIFSLPTNIARVLRSYMDVEEEEYDTNDIDTFDRKNAVPMEKCPGCGKRTYRKTGASCGICENPDRGDGEPCTYSGCG